MGVQNTLEMASLTATQVVSSPQVTPVGAILMGTAEAGAILMGTAEVEVGAILMDTAEVGAIPMDIAEVGATHMGTPAVVVATLTGTPVVVTHMGTPAVAAPWVAMPGPKLRQ